MPGRRRSASRSRTRLPRCAKTKAEFALIVVFPSCGDALVMRIILGGAPNEERRIEVRSARYASEASDFGRTYAISAGGFSSSSPGEAVFSRLRRLPLLEICSGIVPSAGSMNTARYGHTATLLNNG